MIHLHVDQCLSHAIVEGKDGWIIEDDINHLLEFVRTLREEQSQLSCHLELLQVFGGDPILEAVGYWREGGGGS